MKDDRLSALNIKNIQAKVLNMIEFNTQCSYREKAEKAMKECSATIMISRGTLYNYLTVS